MNGRLVIAALLLVAARPAFADGPTPAAETEPTPPVKIITAESPWFIVQGEIPVETTAVARIADRVAAALERAGFNAGAIAPAKITVYINNTEPKASINTADRRTSLIIPLNRYDEPRPVAELIAAAALTRLAQAAERPPAPSRHATAALAWEAVAPERPGTVEYLAVRARELGPLSLDQLDAGPEATDPEHFAISSFWIHRAMRDAADDPRIPIAEAALGIPIERTLSRISPRYKNGGEEAAAWWPAAYYRLTHLRTPAIETTEDSRLRLADLVRIIIEDNGVDHPADNASLIARRAEPSVREELKTRLMQIKTGLPRTNPIWQNAFIARGIFFEALLDPDAKDLPALAASAEKEMGEAFVTAGEINAALHPATPRKVDQ